MKAEFKYSAFFCKWKKMTLNQKTNESVVL